MGQRIKIELLDREYFAESGKHAGDRETAIGGEKKTGRTRRLEQAQYLETAFFRRAVPFSRTGFSLEELVGENEDGRKWVDSFVKMHERYYGLAVDTQVTITPLEMIPVIYGVHKTDPEKPPRHSKPKSGLIAVLPRESVYARIMPPMYFSNGTRIKNFYSRKALFKDRSVSEAFMKDFGNPDDLRPVEGVILGTLNSDEVKNAFWRSGDVFKAADFPFVSFLEVLYHARIGDLRYNTLIIRAWLVNGLGMA